MSCRSGDDCKDCLDCKYSFFEDLYGELCCLLHHKHLCPTLLDDNFEVHYGICKDFVEVVL